MNVQPEVTIRCVEMTPYINKLIARGVEGLEKVFDNLVSINITLEKEQGRRQTGNPYRMQIDVRIPNRAAIVVKRQSMATKRIPDGVDDMHTNLSTIDDGETSLVPHARRSPMRKSGTRQEPLSKLITETFASARRELKKVVDKRRGEVKLPEQEKSLAMVEKIFRDPDYGFLRSTDGEQIYFHRNSVLHKHWEHLALGTAVRYTSELGDKGLQASTVELVDKHGEAETHEQLHDIPSVVPASKVKKKTGSRAR